MRTWQPHQHVVTGKFWWDLIREADEAQILVGWLRFDLVGNLFDNITNETGALKGKMLTKMFQIQISADFLKVNGYN